MKTLVKKENIELSRKLRHKSKKLREQNAFSLQFYSVPKFRENRSVYKKVFFFWVPGDDPLNVLHVF